MPTKMSNKTSKNDIRIFVALGCHLHSSYSVLKRALIFLYRLVRLACLGRWWGTGKLVVSCYPKSTYAGVR